MSSTALNKTAVSELILYATMVMQVDAQTLQFQNQQLEIKCDVQRSKIVALEGKLNQLQSKQTSCDENLSVVNRVWDQVRLQSTVGLSFWKFCKLL